jgi:hypothetical protein
MAGNFNFDWASVTKASLDDLEGQGKKLEPGEHDATITDIRAANTKNGAFGVTLTYAVDNSSSTIKEFICMTTKAGAAMPWGPSKLKRRMMNAGLTAEQITNFRYPSKETELADFKLMLDAKVIITVDNEEIKDGLHKGKSFPRVQKVFPRGEQK